MMLNIHILLRPTKQVREAAKREIGYDDLLEFTLVI